MFVSDLYQVIAFGQYPMAFLSSHDFIHIELEFSIVGNHITYNPKFIRNLNNPNEFLDVFSQVPIPPPNPIIMNNSETFDDDKFFFEDISPEILIKTISSITSNATGHNNISIKMIKLALPVIYSTANITNMPIFSKFIFLAQCHHFPNYLKKCRKTSIMLLFGRETKDLH